MPDLQFEMDQLVEAAAHIERAERALAHFQAKLQRDSAPGEITPDAERIERDMLAGLDVMRQHRALIIATIEAIRKGELPG